MRLSFLVPITALALAMELSAVADLVRLRVEPRAQRIGDVHTTWLSRRQNFT
jgi:hypothetical protein